ncbi:hypothetical protein DFH27DRAFT_589539 [Peziza echinospora]|nr:hypothetical protein DFH27DRAFT_589539 [Peziza echinospora]
MANFILCTPSSSGLSLSIARHLFHTTNLPMILTYRSGSKTDLRKEFLNPFKTQLLRGTLDSSRVNFLKLNVVDEKSIRKAVDEIPIVLGSNLKPTLRWAWVMPGVLYPEKSLASLDPGLIREMFNVNVIGHLLMMKHFAPMLPTRFDAPVPEEQNVGLPPTAQWVNMSARVGSISDNTLGGWYSYRASKAALNMATKTFDLHLEQKHIPAMAVGMHPGTVKTNLGKALFWRGVEMDPGKTLFMPAEAARNVVGVARGLGVDKRGRCWDWKGEEILP